MGVSHSFAYFINLKGVSILVVKSVPWSLCEVRLNALGHFLLLKEKVQGVQITFANVYFPKGGHPQILQDLLPVLLEFSAGLLDVSWGSSQKLSVY